MELSELELSGSQQEDDKEARDLQELLEAFISICSLEDIASAYCSAEGNVDAAANILVELQNVRTGSCDGESLPVKDEKAWLAVRSTKGRKNSLVLSTGIVSNALRRDRGFSHQCRRRASEAVDSRKPVVRQMDPFESKINLHSKSSKTPNSQDLEDFLFSMLHDGFNLEKSKTQNVLRSCGFDVRKSMEELISLSNSNSSKGKEIACLDNNLGNCSVENSHSENSHLEETGSGSGWKGKETILGEKAHPHLAVLEALYSNTNISREVPKRTRLEIGRNRKRVPQEKIVSVCLSSPNPDPETKPTDEKSSSEPKYDDGQYMLFRDAAKSHWDMMKTYYEAAFEAFTAGDREKANHLLEKGKHHNKLAREADDCASNEIIATRSTDKDIFLLDLHMHRTKEAVTFLKQHLQSLAGISSILHLKVIVDSEAEDPTRGRRKQAVMKFLEKQSIVWTVEEGKPGTIFINMDQKPTSDL